FPADADKHRKDDRSDHRFSLRRQILFKKTRDIPEPEEDEPHSEPAEEVHQSVEPKRIPVKIINASREMQHTDENHYGKHRAEESIFHQVSITRRRSGKQKARRLRDGHFGRVIRYKPS